jgi:protease II
VHLHLQSPPLPPASQYFNKSFLVSSEIKQWIRNEKQYTSKLMSFPSIRKNARWFYREMINLEENNRFFEGNDNHGEEIGDYFYFSEPYSLDLYRVLKGNAREYLEENRVLSVEEIVRWANAEFVSLSSVRISPNGRFIAVIADFSAQKNVPRLLVKDTKDGEISEIVCDQARNISQVEWFLDSQGLVFIDMDRNTLRGHQVFAFSLKSGALEMIFEERNGERYLSVSSSKDKEIVYITSLSKTSSEIRIVKFLESENKFDLMHVLPRKEGEIYFIDHVDRTFFILTNAHGCSEFRIDYVLKDASGVDFKNAVNLIEHDSSATIEDVEFFSDFAVLYCRNTLDGHQFMKRYKLLKKASEVIAERIDDLRFESYPFIRPGVNDVNIDFCFRFY